MKSITHVIYVVLLLTISQPVVADGRTDALSDDFRFFCTVNAPNFDQLDQTAKSLNLKVKTDLRPALAPGRSARSKGWVVGDRTGGYELTAAEAVNGNKTISSCGIGAPDALGTEMLNDITEKMRLGKPDKEVVAPNGQMKTLEWGVLMGSEQMRLTLFHAYPKGPGLFLFIAREIETKSQHVQ